MAIRYSIDGKRTLDTESETFTDDDGSKLLVEVGKDSEGDFYLKLGSGYLSNLRISVYHNELTGEDSCIIRGNGKGKLRNFAKGLGWASEKFGK